MIGDDISSDIEGSINASLKAIQVKTGKFHWEVLLRARAIETSCWILAPAQIGEHYPKRKTWGHSVIIDPNGKIIEPKNGIPD